MKHKTNNDDNNNNNDSKTEITLHFKNIRVDSWQNKSKITVDNKKCVQPMAPHYLHFQDRPIGACDLWIFFCDNCRSLEDL